MTRQEFKERFGQDPERGMLWGDLKTGDVYVLEEQDNDRLLWVWKTKVPQAVVYDWKCVIKFLGLKDESKS